MAKTKTYDVLNRIYHGRGAIHQLLVPGDDIELDPDDDTTVELLAKDFIEDPDAPKERTPDKAAAFAKRQIAGAEVERWFPGSRSAARRELATNRTQEALETKILEQTASAEEQAEHKKTALSKAEDPEDKKPAKKGE